MKWDQRDVRPAGWAHDARGHRQLRLCHRNRGDPALCHALCVNKYKAMEVHIFSAPPISQDACRRSSKPFCQATMACWGR